MSVSVNLKSAVQNDAAGFSNEVSSESNVDGVVEGEPISSSFALISPEKRNDRFNWLGLFPLFGLFSGMKIDFEGENLVQLRKEYELYRGLVAQAKGHEARAYYSFMQFNAEIEIAYEESTAALVLGRKSTFDEAPPEAAQNVVPKLAIVRGSPTAAETPLATELAAISETLARQGAAKILSAYEHFFDAYEKLNYRTKPFSDYRNRLGFLHALIGLETFLSNIVQEAGIFNNVALRVAEGAFFTARSGESTDANAALGLLGKYSNFMPQERFNELMKTLGGIILENEFDKIMGFIARELRKKGVRPAMQRALIGGEEGHINLILKGLKKPNAAHLQVIDGEVLFYSIALEKFVPLRQFTEGTPANEAVVAMPALKPLMPNVMSNRLSINERVAFTALQQPVVFMREFRELREGFKIVRERMEKPEVRK